MLKIAEIMTVTVFFSNVIVPKSLFK